jgi:hypothetical protein
MKDRKIRMRGSAQSKALSKDIRKRLDLIDKDMDLKLRTIGCIFSETQNHPEEFHQLYVQPLLDAGLSLEDSLEMLVESVILPN